MIFGASPKAQYESYCTEIDSAISTVLKSGRYILSEEVSHFECEFARYNDVAYGVGAGSGTEALHLALKVFEIGIGDEVLLPSHTAVATATAVILAGATPVFVDIDPNTFTLDLQELKSLITPKTKAIIPVHLYGQAAEMDTLLDLAKLKGVKVIEDCAQAHGALYKKKRVGSMGDIGCFSFYPTKNLGAIGDGGMLITNNESYAQKLKLLREYGWKERYVSDLQGWNSRLDAIQAAILRVKLKYLDQDNQKRRNIAQLYNEGLKNLPLSLPQILSVNESVYHLYVIKTSKRDKLQKYLLDKQIQALIHYPVPIHLQPAYANKFNHKLINTETVAKEILSLPIYPELTEKEAEKVILSVKGFFS